MLTIFVIILNFQLRFETILPENIVVIDASTSKMPTRKRKKKTTAGPVGIGTTESDEEVDKLIEEAEEGSSVLRHLNLSL